MHHVYWDDSLSMAIFNIHFDITKGYLRYEHVKEIQFLLGRFQDELYEQAPVAAVQATLLVYESSPNGFPPGGSCDRGSPVPTRGNSALRHRIAKTSPDSMAFI